MSDRLIGFVEVASAVSITIGATVVSPAAGFVSAGVLGLVFAWRAAT